MEKNIEIMLFAVSSIRAFNYVGRGLGSEVTPLWHQDAASIFPGGSLFSWGCLVTQALPGVGEGGAAGAEDGQSQAA